ncbi:MAG: hypothetical protein A2506_03900 [Elusimicrobia bacterium RIFOXYD12_FULL_66_9]|nr:MAG: hypothetical protein A2506_03900 [Elusimicrobia bacterium RIFOXYD12_FULL_66_9]
MKRALLAALLSLLALSAGAADAPRGGFSTKSFGEGGGYKHPDAATGQYLEDAPRQEVPPSSSIDSEPRPPETNTPASAPIARVSPVAPVPGRPAAPRRDVAPPAKAAPRVSLWRGLVSPLDMPSSQAGVADPDEASERGRRDYDSHILGQYDAASRPRLEGAPEAPMSDASSVSSDAQRLFVSLELDPREAGSLRDAVAGLGTAVGFSADARFQPLSGPAGTSLISGWIPAAQLGLAAMQPGIKRVRVETNPRPSPAREISGEFLVGLRLEDSSRAREAVEAGVRALASTSGFRLTRVIGLETAPDGRVVAVISGVLPLSRLSRAMGRSEVVMITPLSASAASAPAEEAPLSRAGGFARFVAERGLWLLLLTLAMALPGLRRAVGRALSVFVPYR